MLCTLPPLRRGDFDARVGGPAAVFVLTPLPRTAGTVRSVRAGRGVSLARLEEANSVLAARGLIAGADLPIRLPARLEEHGAITPALLIDWLVVADERGLVVQAVAKGVGGTGDHKSCSVAGVVKTAWSSAAAWYTFITATRIITAIKTCMASIRASTIVTCSGCTAVAPPSTWIVVTSCCEIAVLSSPACFTSARVVPSIWCTRTVESTG